MVWTSELQTWVGIPALPLISYNLPHINHLAKVIFVPKLSSCYYSNRWYVHLWLDILSGSCTSLTSITWALGSNSDPLDSQFLKISISGSHSPYLFLFWSVTYPLLTTFLYYFFLLVSISTRWSLILMLIAFVTLQRYKIEIQQVSFYSDVNKSPAMEMKQYYWTHQRQPWIFFPSICQWMMGSTERLPDKLLKGFLQMLAL